ncbi:MFS transporter [Affinirhizobium pseudoryzae]|uniref:MFS transporter n=1 Tax=Allorhizobium pseudoryzae TaxID=379684 RepID=UPI0013ED48BC|nr:MFS transporter [Allorhizobium pseudoryzae]
MTTAFRSFGPVTEGTTATRPVLIVAALLLASFVVGFDTRVFVVGLPDLEGAYSLGSDEASWLSTIANAPQILIASAVAWLVTVFGVRRIMIPTALVYAIVSLEIPMVHDGLLLFVLHAIRGLLLGVFIPATIMVIFRNLDKRYWLIGIAIYALRVPLSQNLGFVLVGFYGDYLGWQWMYWQDVIVAPLIALLLVIAAPKEQINLGLLEHADWGGMLLLGSSMTLLYVGLDQGNRLDWFQSGTIIALLVGGCTLAIGFVINESVVAHPWAHLSVIMSRNIGLGYAIIICYALSSAGASMAIPGFLHTVLGFRPIAISALYLVGAVFPAFLFISVAIILLRRFDARLCIVLGLSLMALGSQLGSHLTLAWGPWNFLSTVLIHTAGQSFVFFAAVVYLVGSSDPSRSTAVSAYIQVVRLGSVELATSILGTLQRHREQFHSDILNGPIAATSQQLQLLLGKLQHVYGQGTRGHLESLSAVSLAIRNQATILAYSDLFVVSFWAAVAGLFVTIFMISMPYGPLHQDFKHQAIAEADR